jgi:virginiamycin B lyase
MRHHLALGCALATLAPLAQAATIGGTVTGPDTAPYAGAFVQAQNSQTKMMESVLSDRQGHYRVPQLPDGDYEVWAKATGLKSAAPVKVKLGGDQPAAMDFALAKTPVQWSELSLYQGSVLLPDGPGKKALFANCFACHGFETRMAANAPHDAAQWKALVDYMVGSMHFFLGSVGHFTDQDEADVVAYLTTEFGPESKLPAPTEMAKYQEVKLPPPSDDALKIVYVEYDMPGPNRMPWSAFPDQAGQYWIPYYGDANMIGRLDPKSGAVTEFPVPNQGTAAIHSAVPAPDGSVWLTEQGANKLGRWDPDTQKITEFQDAYRPGQENELAGGSKHTLRVAANGDVWATGGPLSRFDPKTGKFTPIPEIPSAYGIALDKDATVWFAEFTPQGEIGKIDPATLHVTKWVVPTPKSFPRRIQVDSDGTVWFCEFVAGKLGRFDPKTERITEFALPGAEASPYALGIDRDHRIWYSSEHMDYVGRLDPATGQVTQYPVPQSENTMREFYLDGDGRMWFGSPSNNKVGYFYIAE